jgi:hypothetical protein
MFKILFLSLFVTALVFAGVWTSISGLGTKEIKPDVVYTVDTAGENPRVYEFTPKNNQNYICIIVYTEGAHKSPVMQCIPKSK